MRVLGISILAWILILATVAVEAEDKGDTARAGQKLFARYCAECHGETAQGTDRAPALQSYVKSSEPRMLVSFIKNGNLRAGMPSWSRLPDQQLSQIVAYLQSLAEPRRSQN
jgi:mono/diheme cytochrome c family protein